MADFCKQCSIETFGKDLRDLAIEKISVDEHSKFIQICEGCGWTVTDKDGKCLHIGEHREQYINFINDEPRKEDTSMKMKVHNRDEVESHSGVALAEDYVMISISCPNDPANIPPREHCKDILRLEFDDVDATAHILGENIDKYTLFNRKQAQKILAFFNKYKDVYKYMIIHCDAGISRSPAVAAALTKIQDKTDFKYFTVYHPNRRVYSMLLAEFYNTEN